MKARTFELPIDGLFHISGVNTILQTIKKSFPDMHILQQPHRRSLFLVSGKKRSATELLEAVGDVMELVLTAVQQKKQCPICGIGAIYGWTRLCHDCEREKEEYATLFQLEPIIDEELDELELDCDYEGLSVALDELEATVPGESIFELPFGDEQGALTIEEVFDIVHKAQQKYGADISFKAASAIITVSRAGITEADLLSPIVTPQIAEQQAISSSRMFAEP